MSFINELFNFDWNAICKMSWLETNLGKTDNYVFNLILVTRILRQYLFHWTCAFAYVSAWCNKDHKQWQQPFIFFIWCLSYTLFITLRLCQAMKCTFSAYWYLPYCLICVTSKLAYSANWQYKLIIYHYMKVE